MMSHFRGSGFSLIELMVVMAIMAVTLSLTGGLVIKSVDRQQRMVETERVKELFKNLSFRAYYSGSESKINLNGNRMKIALADQEQVIEFKQLTFVAQEFRINNMASIKPSEFSVIRDDQIIPYQIESLYENSTR
ncbi:type II secretion system protein [Pseudoalteromonas pernae]|uniref:type II secretion system protein n=1 Tax=Pseudoalteromonas pernae TaxID=3118054 RepID=UPI003242F700